ncbi:helix-turn-helix domain-containing protein [Burkholderia cenocepacia]|uniref:helix-turn-helix domain-containing protein n=1 Tax=Burkholderia cenocepacia TaxID=95486 RepID=UPI00076115A7|nr:helix-turn-helix transcriptional regulator [Burkholderia cenocepacia]KWU23426.1 hypothetical protein AS149_37185 [Burkholderia cenocepacia]
MADNVEGADDNELKEALRQIATTLKSARLAAGISGQDLARRCGISYSTLLRLEDGNAGIAIGAILRAFKALDLPAPTHISVIEGQEVLPQHALHLESEAIDEAVEEATRAACRVLDEMFPEGTRPEVDGIGSEFQGLLANHLRALLRGQPYQAPQYLTHLRKLVYSDADLGRNYHLPEGADGFLVRVVDQRQVLEDGRFKPIIRVSDMYSSWENAATALRLFVEKGEHPPGPVRIVPGYWAGEAGVSFTPAR